MAQAQQYGLEVVVGIRQSGHTNNVNPLAPLTSADITRIVQMLEEYPAVAGYYTADEPTYRGFAPGYLQMAYDTIKSVSDKPVYMAFCSQDVSENNPALLQNAYDIGMFDYYPLDLGESLFTDIEDEYFGGVRTAVNWKSSVSNAIAALHSVNKPMINIIQAFGQDAAGAMPPKRLPTSNELRYMTYYALLTHNTPGIALWSMRKLKTTAAHPGEPYPYDGNQWISEVATPLSEEVNAYSDAVMAGEIAGAVDDGNFRIKSRVYFDDDTDLYYLLAINDSDVAVQATMNLNIPVYPSTLARYDGSAVPMNGDSFVLNFAPYEVINLSFLRVQCGDANRDGLVNLGDLQILGDNWQSTNASWGEGDFTGEGAVTLADLQLLADNWGYQIGTESIGGVADWAVPEPTLFTLIGFGGLLLAGRHRNK
ncbi:MAG: hypothetical protein IT445_18765 [Phycisphaeraceae bacterium]|nr:hypothetical protein [Phycisphaeraceae bacterium]